MNKLFIQEDKHNKFALIQTEIFPAIDQESKMKEYLAVSDNNISSQLEQVRSLDLPSREDMLVRAPSVQRFWDNNRHLLVNAWKEWEEGVKDNLVIPDEGLLDANLRHAVDNAWEEPVLEHTVANLWQEGAPGVFQAQFFEPEKLIELRHYLNEVATASIPLRPPYGIALNRYGAMLDKRSEGYLAAPRFQAFYDLLLDKYMRPIARLLFPEVMGYDTQTFGFSIKWQEGMDTSLRLHTDASAVTMNINMNLPDEDFLGSEVDFFDPKTNKVKRLSFEPGMAMIHRGSVAHTAQPITRGERSNIVLWLYGHNMQIPTEGEQSQFIDPQTRWTIPTDEKDNVAPF